MRGELPVFKRCCFCLPLRYGLIAWGYLKLIASSFFIIELSFSLNYAITVRRLHGNEKNYTYIDSDIIITSIAIAILIVDFILTTVFIIGGHKKNVKLLRIFYFYSIAAWVLTILLTAVLIGLTLNTRLRYYVSLRSCLMLILDFSVFFVNIAVLTYFVLLLRSEILKLRNNCEFRFVNNENEAECKMKCDGEVADRKTHTEDVYEEGTFDFKIDTMKTNKLEEKISLVT